MREDKCNVGCIFDEGGARARRSVLVVYSAVIQSPENESGGDDMSWCKIKFVVWGRVRYGCWLSWTGITRVMCMSSFSFRGREGLGLGERQTTCKLASHTQASFTRLSNFGDLFVYTSSIC